MKQTILIGLLSAVAVTGCKSEQWVRDDGSVRFAAYRPANAAETKVTGTNFDAGDEIAVFAPLAGNPIHGEYDTQGNGPAKDRRYVADDNNNFAAKTESDKIRYSTTSAKLDFYAVYPAMGPARDTPSSIGTPIGSTWGTLPTSARPELSCRISIPIMRKRKERATAW